MRTVARVGLTAVAVPVLLVGAGAGTASANEFVVNDTGSAVMVDASYTRGDVSGYVGAWQQQNGDGILWFFEQSGDWVQCTGADTKKTTDDTYGFVGSFVYGEGAATVTVAPRYATGTATGTTNAYREDIDDCTGTWNVTDIGQVPVRVDLAATGPVTTTRDRSGYHVPSQFNDRYSFSFTGRTASGTVDVAGDTASGDGVIGKNSWTYHSN